jgi:hypothetical protein
MLHDVEVDWGWPKLDAAGRVIARRHEARLKADRTALTLETVERILEAAARELPGKAIRARGVDDDGIYTWQVVEGDLYPGGDFDDTGMFPGELTAEDFRAAGVDKVVTPLVCPDAIVQALEARGPAPLSTLVQSAWQVASEALPVGFRMPEGPRHMQTVALPVDLWAQIKQRASSEGRTMSYVVQRALAAAYELAV